MTISPDTPPNIHTDSKHSGSRSSSRSRATNGIWMLFLAILALVGIYLIAVVASIAIRGASDGAPVQVDPQPSVPSAPPAPADPK